MTVHINFDYDKNQHHLPGADDLKKTEKSELTEAEKRVLRNIALPAKLIAEKLNLSIYTVKKHIQNMLDKTSCKNSKDLTVWAMKKNLI